MFGIQLAIKWYRLLFFSMISANVIWIGYLNFLSWPTLQFSKNGRITCLRKWTLLKLVLDGWNKMQRMTFHMLDTMVPVLWQYYKYIVEFLLQKSDTTIHKIFHHYILCCLAWLVLRPYIQSTWYTWNVACLYCELHHIRVLSRLEPRHKLWWGYTRGRCSFHHLCLSNVSMMNVIE